MQARFYIFRSAWSSWQSLFGEAASYLTELGPERVLGVSHSADKTEGVITVWYWDQPVAGRAGPPVRVAFEAFRGLWATWQTLFHDAAEFVSRVGPQRVIGVSHSEDKDAGVVTVWYWEEA